MKSHIMAMIYPVAIHHYELKRHTVLGTHQLVNNFAKCVSIIVLNQYDVARNDFCKRLLSFAAGHHNDIGKIRKEINAIQKVRIDENQFYDKDHEDEFWTWARSSAYEDGNKVNSTKNGVVTLGEIIKFADGLCVLTYRDYARTSRELVNVLIKRMVKDEEVDSKVDGILGHSVAMFASLVYDGEMYLRPLYLLFKRNGLEKLETDE